MTGYPELVIGGVLFAPFVALAAGALTIVLAVRPLLHLIAFDRAFSNPALAHLCLYVIALAALVTLF